MIKVWLALLIAVVMLPGPGAAAKVRPGAAVVLTTRGGQEIRGELYAVKKDALTIAGPEGDRGHRSGPGQDTSGAEHEDRGHRRRRGGSLPHGRDDRGRFPRRGRIPPAG
jgi:hypothetical protein